jgi:hypothetical protein
MIVSLSSSIDVSDQVKFFNDDTDFGEDTKARTLPLFTAQFCMDKTLNTFRLFSHTAMKY